MSLALAAGRIGTATTIVELLLLTIYSSKNKQYINIQNKMWQYIDMYACMICKEQMTHKS